MPLERNTQIWKKRPFIHRKSYQKIQPSFFSEHVVPSSVKKEAWSSILKLHAPCVTPCYMWKNRPVFSHGRHNHDHYAVFRSKQETRKALYWSLAFNSLVLTISSIGKESFSCPELSSKHMGYFGFGTRLKPHVKSKKHYQV